MSSAGNTPAAPRPSVFISYASEDRPAARLLRDALLATGLDVWYDENELTGGDAWDQKLRRQIRDCDYFMPVISATTERRKEGYFRREWRLAAERTMDMADDVLFLLPVTIDETSEAGARVPDRFLAVQWLRAPGGRRTAALDALAQRLLAGDHATPTRPPLLTRPPERLAAGTLPKGGSHQAHPVPPPMPPFPEAPEKGGVGHWLKFVAEVLWWFVTATWMLLVRLPRWMRVALSVWLVFTIVGARSCSRDIDSRAKSKKQAEAAPSSAEIERAVNATAEQIAAVLEKNANAKDWGKIGEEIGRRFGVAPERPTGPAERPTTGRKMLMFVPFAPDADDKRATQFAQNVFSRCYGQIVLTRKNEAAISPVLPVGTDDAALAALGKQLHAEFVLGTKLTKSTDGVNALSMRMIRSQDGTVTWSEEFPTVGADAKEVGAKIAEAISNQLPPPRKRP
jgi:TolB-like protein